jgi:exodeoxyribonuclease V beta subunit
VKVLTSIFDIEWKQRVLIEASAGTGKTYTIVGLFVRLLAEKKLSVDQVLVMTFTKKATAELRDRIFARLQECLAILEGTYSDTPDTFLKEFAEHFAGRNDVFARIRESIKNFDENQVTTIHGFCQKILSEEALLAGTPFEIEVAQQDEMLIRATEDFWRQFIYQHNNTEAGKYFISKLLDLAKSPDDLRKRISPLLRKPYANVEGDTLDDPKRYLEKVIALRKKMTDCWFQEEEKILSILRNCELSRYQQFFESRLKHLKNFLYDDKYEIDVPEKIEYFTSEYLQDRSNIPKTKDVDLPENHRFFELCTQFQALTDNIDSVKTTILYEAANSIKRMREGLADQSGVVTYDDMLLNVMKALEQPTAGKELAQSLSKKYPFALVDEFQDTDPIQYTIFQKIFENMQDNEGSLCMIGDPKQAIYAFRGADVYTYLKAREDAGKNVFTLTKNYRSTPTIVRAINQLFKETEHPFLEKEIEYFDSIPGLDNDGSPFLIDGQPADQMNIAVKEGLDKNKQTGRDFSLNYTVKEVVKLISMGIKKTAVIEGRPLRAGDIAILVNTHSQAAEMKARLKETGIDSVTYSKQKVFNTYEADRVEMVLAAILDPHDSRNFNSALLSGFFGYDLPDLIEKKGSEVAHLQMIQEFQELYDLWRTKGFYPMFRRLIFSSGRLEMLAELNQSERVITNLYQIAEICSEMEKREDFDPQSLFTWFRRENREPGEGDENTLMLESDQDLVKISTIHNSKGLQYPVVFCPYLWDYRQNRSDTFEYHEEKTFEYRINIEQKKNENYQLASRRAQFESIAEDVRKAYVAVTRAQYYVDLCWVNHPQSNISGFGALLAGREGVNKFINDKIKIGPKKSIGSDFFPNLIQKCAEKADHSIGLHFYNELKSPEAISVERTDSVGEEFDLRMYNGRKSISVRQMINSFSSINRHSDADVYEPDYDQVLESYAGAFESDAGKPEDLSIFTFPKGATAGTAIHKLFEDESFSFSDVMNTDYSEMIEGVLKRYGIDGKWTSVANVMMKHVAKAHIPGLDLSAVDQIDQLREMEFLFRANRVEAEKLFSIIREGQEGDFGGIPQHFMTGFIDLVVRQNDQFFIVDYKSNYLGDQLDDYSTENLKVEIEAHGYDLQYHLYTLALVKYLKKRLPNFSYDSHIGGVAYLFVRGNREGESTGVWFHKPDESVIRQLDDVIGGRR